MTIALPRHEPCGDDGCGQLDEANVATCIAVRTWPDGFAHDEPGCGATFALHVRCGLRAVKDGGCCTACFPGGVS